LKIGVPAQFYVDDLESDVAAALDATIAALRKLGRKSRRSSCPTRTWSARRR